MGGIKTGIVRVSSCCFSDLFIPTKLGSCFYDLPQNHPSNRVLLIAEKNLLKLLCSTVENSPSESGMNWFDILIDVCINIYIYIEIYLYTCTGRA